MIPVALCLALAAVAEPAAPHRSEARLLAFSDYHSHALPFYSEGAPGQGGIARAVAYLKAARARPGTLVVSGGDMLNRGTPAWSDEHRCVEWPWLGGLVDAMALGNHDLDYGYEEFERCRASAGFPVLAANLLREDGAPFLVVGGKPYLVKNVAGVRIGLFAVGGPDVQRLIKRENLPPGARWADAVETARGVVRALRASEKVSAVLLIGHELREDDLALAAAVPGIDVVLGSHAHYKGQLQLIPGTSTWYVSPYQYLSYVSELRLGFERGRLTRVEGGLVKMDAARPEDPEIAAKVAALQRALVAKRPERFALLGRAAVELSDAGVSQGESVIGNWATDLLRAAASAHAFFATASGFRAAIPPGDVTLEAFMAAIPYTNEVVTAQLTGAQLRDWLAFAVSRRGSDGFSQESGLRYTLRDGQPREIQVLKDPADPRAGFAPLDPDATYRVATTDFQAFEAAGYKERLAQAANVKRTGIDVHAVLTAALAAGPVAAALDGRVR